ncbi:glucose-6-phosphate dehydrogenase, partial [Streptomyces sp. NPDC005009]
MTVRRLVVFGGTGDLTGRFLLPALAALRAAGHIDDRFGLMAASREDWNRDRYREWVDAQLDQHGGVFPADARRTVTASADYRRADVTDPADVAAAVAGDDPVAVYL